jgi:hypothetical protein
MADELVAEYYRQRATAGGLMISEGIAVNVEVSRFGSRTQKMVDTGVGILRPEAYQVFPESIFLGRSKDGRRLSTRRTRREPISTPRYGTVVVPPCRS